MLTDGGIEATVFMWLEMEFEIHIWILCLLWPHEKLPPTQRCCSVELK